MTQLQLQLDMTQVSQRWNTKRAFILHEKKWIDKTNYRVEQIDRSEGKEFVLKHHYSGSYPAAIIEYGLFERTGLHQEELVGVIVFSSPVQPKAGAAYGAEGEPFCDLGRMILLDRVPSGGETYFQSQARRLLSRDKLDADGRPKYSLILSYSDPIPRFDARGRVRFCGHYGASYYEGGALYVGRASPRTLVLTSDATVLNERTMSKLRNDESGATGAYEILIAYGAPRIRPGEDGRTYYNRAIAEGPFRKIRHRGNHVYAFPSGGRLTRARIRDRMDRKIPFPRFTDSPIPLTPGPIV